MANVAINGFGRIGRLVLRIGIDHPELNFVAVNDLTDADTLAYLFEYDSVYRRFDGTVEVTDSTLRVNGKEIKVLSEKDPGKLPWRDLGVDLVIESSGHFETKEKSMPHIEQAGAKKVMITAPADGADHTIAYGVNDDVYDPEKDQVVSTGSCTTNALAPVAKVLMENFGITYGLMNTTHSYTATQSLVDAPKKGFTRGRAAAINLVPTTTGAAKAIGSVLPDLAGKLDGFAVRVPTPAGSILDLTALLERDVTVDDINKAFHNAEGDPRYKGVFCTTDTPLVSTDIIGNRHSSIIEPSLTFAKGPLAKVLSWYDNEYGFTCRAVDVAAMMVTRVREPAMAR